ncbi:helix-turn-helix protein [Mucilaginibacter oryzae]|uniref:Helix-turn-helix protein n=1 Tax=Mucilaginibacter oryzae TaxID=468058 RepID=A0A316HQW8_9SPHI|nr:helix-turn-helix transcriptional regulator [Mucilaginibacter oryzae]PWK77272.1 helix-turn-helix protein [Mucilaginibacter oryzae]
MKEQQMSDQIGAQIREARSAQNMTRQQLADKCGISPARVAKAENYSRNVSIGTLQVIIEKGLGLKFEISFEF